MYELYGLPPNSELVFESWADRLHPDDRQRAVSEISDVFESGKKFDTTFRIITPAGEFKHLRAAAGVYRDERNVDFLVGANWDITEAMLAIEKLNEAQRLGQIGNWSWDAANDDVEWSDQTYSLFGINKSDSKIDIKMVASLYTEESQRRLEAAVREALENGTPFSLELETRDCQTALNIYVGREACATMLMGRYVVSLEPQ